MPTPSHRARRRELLCGGFALLAQPLLPMLAMAAEGPSTGRPLATSGGPRCIARPTQTEGPFFVDERLHRGDIRSDPVDGELRPGVPLRLSFLVSRMEGGRCQPAGGIRVDVWHCDAHGRYSEVDASGRLAPDGHGFLRGFQLTDARGRADFLTIYPGWYPGRTVHVHFKLRTAPNGERGEEFTSQLYFDDALTDRVHRLPPYKTRGPRRTQNPDDGIFRHGGRELTLDARPDGKGYAAIFEIGLPVSSDTRI